eukprot:79800-Pleurochrysis_carterae.AAC.2
MVGVRERGGNLNRERTSGTHPAIDVRTCRVGGRSLEQRTQARTVSRGSAATAYRYRATA